MAVNIIPCFLALFALNALITTAEKNFFSVQLRQKSRMINIFSHPERLLPEHLRIAFMTSTGFQNHKIIKC
jgi:hypothetical protein